MIYVRTLKPHPWKVPFRHVYCDTFRCWIRTTIWCLFVLKVFPDAIDERVRVIDDGTDNCVVSRSKA